MMQVCLMSRRQTTPIVRRWNYSQKGIGEFRTMNVNCNWGMYYLSAQPCPVSRITHLSILFLFPKYAVLFQFPLQCLKFFTRLYSIPNSRTEIRNQKCLELVSETNILGQLKTEIWDEDENGYAKIMQNGCANLRFVDVELIFASDA